MNFTQYLQTHSPTNELENVKYETEKKKAS